MNLGPELNLLTWIYSFSPVALLVVSILWRGWSAPKAGGVAWLLAVGLGVMVFGGSSSQIAIASAKGLSLSLFVLSIVWTSVFMFNLVDKLEGINAIGRTMAKLSSDRLIQALLVGWGFSSFIQGITGFGVPVAVAAPLLIMLGFSAPRAAAMALVGHGWAVTFGSMGSSYYTIQLVTGIDGHVIGPHMAILFAPIVIASGFLVAHINGGFADVRRSFWIVTVAGSIMAALQIVIAWVGAPQIASSVPAIAGMVVIAVIGKTPLVRPSASSVELTDASTSEDQQLASPVPFRLAFLPYALLITLSVISQIGPIKNAVSDYKWGLSYPGFVTGKGFVVDAVSSLAPIRILNHPAPLIVISVSIACLAFALSHRWQPGVLQESAKLTYAQCIGTTVGVSTMVMMASAMGDMGMTVLLAKGIASASGPLFPLFSPFIGLLGSFMTGSNTNSNVMFGLLQVETANALGIGSVTIASIQSIGASVGSSLAPAKVLVGAAVVGLSGREKEIFTKVTVAILLLVLLSGLEALLLVELLPQWTR